MNKLKLPTTFLLFLILILCTTADGFGKSNINIGVIGPMKFSLGQEMWNGAILASSEVNSSGKISVQNQSMGVRLIKIDSNEFLNASSAANAAEMLFFRNRVDFLVGGFRSEAVLEVQDVAMDYKKIFISAGAASMELTRRVAQNYNRYKYYFRGGSFNNYELGKGCFLQLGHVAQRVKAMLGLERVKVAIAAERTQWVDSMIEAAKKTFPVMGIELAGIFRPSSLATDLSPEIRAIAKTDAPIVLTWFSSNVGAAFVAQASEMKLPAVMMGINGDAIESNFWEATNGKADYVMTLASFAEDVEISSMTKPFVDSYKERFGGIPGFTAGGTYTAIACTLLPAIRQANTLDADTLVEVIENRKYKTPHGLYVYQTDELGRQTHEIKFGVDYVLPLGIQWQNGSIKAVWPNKYQEKPGAKPFTHKGVVDFQIPEWVIAKHKKS